MTRFIAGAAGTLMIASALMVAGAGSASASERQPVVSVSHFGGDTLTLSAVAGHKSTITVTVKLDVTADQASDPWTLQALRTEIDPVLGAQACGCGLFGSPYAGWSSPPLILKGGGATRSFKETAVVDRFVGSDGIFDVNGFHVSVTDTKTGVSSGWVDINSVPVR